MMTYILSSLLPVRIAYCILLRRSSLWRLRPIRTSPWPGYASTEGNWCFPATMNIKVTPPVLTSPAAHIEAAQHQNTGLWVGGCIMTAWWIWFAQKEFEYLLNSYLIIKKYWILNTVSVPVGTKLPIEMLSEYCSLLNDHNPQSNWQNINHM